MHKEIKKLAVGIERLAKGDAWLPVSQEATAGYMNALRDQIKKKKTALKDGVEIPLHPVMQEFQYLINNDAIVRMNFTKMIDQVPAYYREQGEDGKYLHGFYLASIEEMILLINHILTTAPEYNDTDLVGFPINTILNWTMGVPAGAAAFRNEKVNEMFRKILAEWTKYLDSRESLYVFTTEKNGWCSKEALSKLNMGQYLNGLELAQFEKGIKTINDPFPYKSWNNFFIRKFKDKKQRPIADSAIVSACDSQVYNTQTGAKLQDWFWLKSQPYSLWDMLANKDGKGAKQAKRDQKHFKNYVKPFDGGTVYQAFLSAFKYHRWHSPVSGTVKKAYVKDGTYYSATQAEGLDQGSPDQSQGYIAHTATRALIFIEADDPAIGLMCVMPIGMSEVSSCIINPEILKGLKKKNPKVRVEKGDELGYFQFGGSTHCLIFQKDVIDRFTVEKDETVEMGQCIALLKQ